MIVRNMSKMIMDGYANYFFTGPNPAFRAIMRNPGGPRLAAQNRAGRAGLYPPDVRNRGLGPDVFPGISLSRPGPKAVLGQLPVFWNRHHSPALVLVLPAV